MGSIPKQLGVAGRRQVS
ncbi:hypothetical protein VCCP10303_3455, partial [Vibrio cholerae CP1030(3)]